MEEEANKEEGEEEEQDGNDIGKGTEDSRTTELEVPSEECTGPRLKKKRARSQDPLLEGITVAATLLGNKIEEAYSKLSEAIQCDMDIQKKTSLVNSELSKISSLSMMDRYKAAHKITRESENVLLFSLLKKKRGRAR